MSEDTQGEQGAGTEKPEPDAKAKEAAAKMMTAYEDRPTLILPGSGKTITGTAVNDWLDADGNPKYGNDNGSGPDGETPDDEEARRRVEESIESDKEFNAAILQAANEKAGPGQAAEEKADEKAPADR